jgi:hypothetical protein
MTKEEVYNGIVDIQKNTGQGLSGIVRVLGESSQDFSDHIDTLIEEGSVIANDTGRSLGHPESNMFYTPSKGYNVWEDESTSSQNLAYVRFYLGRVGESNEERDEDDIQRYLSPTAKERIQNSNFMTRYAEWLNENEESLQVMLNLGELEVVGVELSDEDIKFVKERDWYTDNKTIKECVSLSKERCDQKYNKIISVHEELIVLYGENPTYAQSKKDALEDIREIKKEILPQRKRIHAYLSQLDQSSLIQEQFEETLA